MKQEMYFMDGNILEAILLQNKNKNKRINKDDDSWILGS
jgi:hypothetical protein